MAGRLFIGGRWDRALWECWTASLEVDQLHKVLAPPDDKKETKTDETTVVCDPDYSFIQVAQEEKTEW